MFQFSDSSEILIQPCPIHFSPEITSPKEEEKKVLDTSFPIALDGASCFKVGPFF